MGREVLATAPAERMGAVWVWVKANVKQVVPKHLQKFLRFLYPRVSTGFCSMNAVYVPWADSSHLFDLEWS
jgi:hypothetical protein